MTLHPKDARRKYNGNIYFYSFCSLNRAPSFLQRNIRTVLQHHKQALARVRRPAQAKMKGGNHEDRENRRAKAQASTGPEAKKWSVQELQDILARRAFNSQSPYLRIDVTDIKDKLAQFRDLEVPRQPIAKRMKVQTVNANCSCTIWRKAGDTVVEQVRACEIQSKTLSTGERWASVSLERPFEVPIASLQPSPGKTMSFGDGPSFSMELKLMAANLDDDWPPVALRSVPLPKMAHFWEDDDLVRFPILTAKWPRLPDIPRTAKESLLEMKAWQTSPSDITKYVEYTPKLGLVVDVDWFETPSPLQQANQETRKTTPAPLVQTISEPKVEILGRTEWVFEEALESVPTRKYPAYHCPFCPLRHSHKQNRMRRFGSADEFCLHLKNSHSALRWDYTPKYSFAGGSSQVTHDGKITVRPWQEYDEIARGTKGTDPREMEWVRPDTPLDIEAFLRGDESWLGKKKRASHLPSSSRHGEGAPRTKASVGARPAPIHRRPPEQIPNLPERRRRTFRVPRAPPGVHFYRNITKRVLQEGEDVSESDDDIDAEWLLQKHADTIDSFTDTTREEKEFINRFDRHMLCEDLASDLHASEALIRFCRHHRHWLRRDDMRLEFHKKVASLKIQGAISPKIILACMRIINSAAEELVNGGSAMGRTGEQPLELNYGADPIERGHIYENCQRCNIAIRGSRKLIRCANPTCPKPDFHLQCVNLSMRPPNWRCPSCITPPFPPYEAHWPPHSPSFALPHAPITTSTSSFPTPHAPPSVSSPSASVSGARSSTAPPPFNPPPPAAVHAGASPLGLHRQDMDGASPLGFHRRDVDGASPLGFHRRDMDGASPLGLHRTSMDDAASHAPHRMSMDTGMDDLGSHAYHRMDVDGASDGGREEREWRATSGSGASTPLGEGDEGRERRRSVRARRSVGR